ncbi:P4Hc [Seminavis robusta]|uniref:P4Hc n=1 Tax=Seminavis robusta TaxID=568900 RepID=A0A9N8E2C9_9STRA|nr:P4Hc [Seminavis robusta]|eukprot:Sro475_g150370.1 P4Hc (559) ;mRNA; f:21160-22836
MGKNNKKRKRTNHALFHAVKARNQGVEPIKPVIPSQSTPAKTDTTSDEISDADLATTIRTLETLVSSSSDSTMFHGKRFKELRRTLHPLVLEQLQSYDKGVDYRHKVTHALQHHQWSDALAALRACQDFQQYPKQGTVQRWVRECSALEDNGGQMPLLQAILRLSAAAGAGAGDGNKHDPGQALAAHLANQPENKEKLVILEGWKWWDNDSNINSNSQNDSISQEKTEDDKEKQEEEKEKEAGEKTANKQEEGKVAKKEDSKKEATRDDNTPLDNLKSRIVYRETAAERTPPNHYDLLLHAITKPDKNLITWSDNHSTTQSHPIPFLPQPARVLPNVLTRDECQQLRRVTTTLGYRSDHPVSQAQPTGIDSCEWMVDSSSILDVIWERVQPHLPASLTVQNKKTVQLFGINPRWRCFRYGQDCVYRPHLDGSWPLCYLDEEGNYHCPKQQQQQYSDAIKSYLTFLIYLNDDFEGGETRYYLPQGVARGIVPRAGSVVVFPQGNLASLIHEGSQVTKGTKYVIRTDVLYRPAGKAQETDDDTNKEEEVEEEDGNDEQEQ